MTLADFVTLCRSYADLGGAVTDQIDAVVDGRTDDCNPNALRMIRDWLQRVERYSGNDEELMDEVGGAREAVAETLRRLEGDQ